MGLTPVDHPSPYRVSWVDSTSLPICLRCLVSLQFHAYHEDIWCDVLPMEVESVILGRPWLYDRDATLHGRSNTCTFDHECHRITLHPSQPRSSFVSGPTGPVTPVPSRTPTLGQSQSKTLMLITPLESTTSRSLVEIGPVWRSVNELG